MLGFERGQGNWFLRGAIIERKKLYRESSGELPSGLLKRVCNDLPVCGGRQGKDKESTRWNSS